MFQQGLFGEPIEEFRPPAPVGPVAWDFEGEDVRLESKGDKTWFSALDACAIAGLKNVSQALARLDDDQKRDDLISNDVVGRTAKMWYVSESGLYSLLLSGRLRKDSPQYEKVKRFRRWVTDEVLPQIRRTGSYSPPQPTRVEKVAKRLKSDLKTAERRVEVIDRNKQSSARLADAGTPRGGFPAWFDALNQAQFNGKTSADLKRWLGLKNWQTPLDHMGEIPLSQRSHAICLAERKIEEAQAISGKPLGLEAQLQIVHETVSFIVNTSFKCLGDGHGFFIRDDRRRGKVLDVTLRLTAA